MLKYIPNVKIEKKCKITTWQTKFAYFIWVKCRPILSFKLLLLLNMLNSYIEIYMFSFFNT